MPKIIETEKKIEIFKVYSINNYGIDVSQNAKRAIELNRYASICGFAETDVFLSDDGTIVLVAYSKNHCLEISIFHNTHFNVMIEDYKEIISLQCDIDIDSVKSYLRDYGTAQELKIWSSLEYSEDIHMTNIETDLLQTLFSVERVQSRCFQKAVSGTSAIALSASS